MADYQYIVNSKNVESFFFVTQIEFVTICFYRPSEESIHFPNRRNRMFLQNRSQLSFLVLQAPCGPQDLPRMTWGSFPFSTLAQGKAKSRKSMQVLICLKLSHYCLCMPCPPSLERRMCVNSQSNTH